MVRMFGNSIILGRFGERKRVLDKLRDALRNRNYSPILFDFTGPSSRTTDETIMLLARMARFVIADITDAKSVLQELRGIVPEYPSVPIQPLLMDSQFEPGMLDNNQPGADRIKRAFSLALQAGKIMTKPHIPLLKENNVRQGFFDRDNFEAVRAKMTEDVKPLVTFANITGSRIRSEVRGLQRPQVDFKAGRVRLEPGTTKNDAARVFPFTAELRELLENQKAKTDALKKKGIICPWVFYRRGKPIREFRRSWKTACKEAGVPGRIPHDFRRTAVRNLVRAGIPERVAMMMTGHKTRSVFERYNIVSEGDLDMAAVSSTVSSTVTVSGSQAQKGLLQKLS